MILPCQMNRIIIEATFMTIALFVTRMSNRMWIEFTMLVLCGACFLLSCATSQIKYYGDNLSARLKYNESGVYSVQLICLKEVQLNLGWLEKNLDTLKSNWVSTWNDTLSIDLSRTANCGMVGSTCRYKIKVLVDELCPRTSKIDLIPGATIIVPLERIISISDGSIHYIVITIDDNTNISVPLY